MFRVRFFFVRVFLVTAIFVSALSVNRSAFAKQIDLKRQYGIQPVSAAPVVYTTVMVGQARDIFQKVNYQRRMKGMLPLVWDEGLAKMASAFSKQMADDKFFAHVDNEGRTMADRVVEFEIKDWQKLGENLYMAKGFLEPVDLAIDGWMKSKTHRENILDPDWTHTGVGVYSTKDGATYFTQEFMRKVVSSSSASHHDPDWLGR